MLPDVPSRHCRMSSPLTLAIADDDALQTELLATWLELLGHTVIRFDSGDHLLAWATQAPQTVDAFVLDVDMPGRDGIESCRELRRLPAYAATPAVFVTSHTAETVSARASTVGVSAMVSKDGEMLPRLASWIAELRPAA